MEKPFYLNLRIHMSVDASKNHFIAFNSIKFANGLDFYNKICKIYNE